MENGDGGLRFTAARHIGLLQAQPRGKDGPRAHYGGFIGSQKQPGSRER